MASVVIAAQPAKRGEHNGAMADELPPERLALTFKAFVDAVAATAVTPENKLHSRLTRHLGRDPIECSSVAEELPPYEHPNLQVALDDYLGDAGRQSTLFGLAANNKRFMAPGLSDLLGPWVAAQISEGPVDYLNFRHPDGDIRCVQFGIYEINDDGKPLVALVTGPQANTPRQQVRIEVIAAEEAIAAVFLKTIRERMSRLNVYRGHVISIGFDRTGGLVVTFHELRRVARGDVVLPVGLMERVERQTLTFSRHAKELAAAGRSLKRGLLLHGLPGVGKTLTIMYLAGLMPERTVFLSTGRALGAVGAVGQMARSLAPAMVVVEDVDLIAQERTMPHAGPVLFELLNEMDGLREDEDVIFVLTTNRADILEPALAARPGRIDLAVELPLPDPDGRRALIELYAHGLDITSVDIDTLVTQTEGTSPAYIKELLRKAALLAAEAGHAQTLTNEDVVGAVEELSAGGELAQRLLGYRPADSPPTPPGPMQTGYPAFTSTVIARSLRPGPPTPS